MENENSIKKSNSKKYLTIILIIIGLTLAFIGGYLLSNMKNDKNNNEQKENKETIKEDNKVEKGIDEQLEQKKEAFLNRKEETDAIINDTEIKDKLIEINNDLSNAYSNLNSISKDNEVVLNLFDIYHAIGYGFNSKEHLAIYQLNENDLIDISCDFFKLPDNMINHVGEVEPYYCGDFTDEINKAWQSKNASLVVDLIHKNMTKGIKEDTLRNKMKELFGTDEITSSNITLSPEYKNKHWWSEMLGFIFVEKVDGKDYFALTRGSGGDPSDNNTYYIIDTYKTNDRLFIVYEVLSNSEPMDYDLNVITFKRENNEHYIYEDHKTYLHKTYSTFN